MSVIQLLQKENTRIRAYLEQCSTIKQKFRNKAIEYLEYIGINDLVEVGFKERQGYISFLKENGVIKKACEYVKAFDHIMFWHLKRSGYVRLQGKQALSYHKSEIFLLYDVPYSVAVELDKTINKEELHWNFNLSDLLLKQQIIDLINCILEKWQEHKERRQYLLSLKNLYIFSCLEGIEDILMLDKWQEKQLYIYISSKEPSMRRFISKMLNFCRRELFLHSKIVNWNANVWYLDRFDFDTGRINESSPIRSLSFLEIQNPENKKLYKEYLKTVLGIGDLALRTIQMRHYANLDFLNYLDNNDLKISHVTSEYMDNYFKDLTEKITSNNFNRKLIYIYHFFCFLLARRYIEKIPFLPQYYLIKIIDERHKNRSIHEDTLNQLLNNLEQFPLHLRLMFLIMWATGLRKNEICQLKANGFVEANNATWVRFYQTKMKHENMLPIPQELYNIMCKYIDKYNIPANEYIFKNKKQSAYNAITFSNQMISLCNRIGLDGEYVFRAHDFRHTVATQLYAQGTSIQAIRDYLGHNNEDMTKQYIDFIPNRIADDSKKYYQKKRNLLVEEEF